MPSLQDNVAATVEGVSVAMCTYNGEAYPPQQLVSIAEQSIPPSELVVCDDGSTDSTIELLQRFASCVPFPVRIVQNSKNLGSTGNFEQAIRLCRHEFIALCDQDDIWHANKLEVQVALLAARPDCGGVFSDGELLNPAGDRESRTLWQSFWFDSREQKLFRSGHALDLLLRGNVATGMTMMFRSSLRDRLLPIPQSWIHDYWLAFMLCIHSTLAACPEKLVVYRLHASQSIGAPESFKEKAHRIRTRGLGDYFRRAKLKSQADYSRSARALEDLDRYLADLHQPTMAELRAAVKTKAEFCRFVATALETQPPPRFSAIVARAKLYGRYTNLPLRGMLRDLFV